MDYQQDYVMRLIKQMMQAVSHIVFHKTDTDKRTESIQEKTTEGAQEIDLLALADSGQINEAENQLYESLDTTDMSQLRKAFAFYEHINEYQNDFLEEHDYSREEVLDGIKNISSEFGISGIVDALL